VFIAHNPRPWFGRCRPTSQFIFFGPILWCSSPCGRLSPHHQELRGRHLEFCRALLDGGGLIGRLDGAKPDGFGSDLVDSPGRRLRLRFGLLGHGRSIGRSASTFNRLLSCPRRQPGRGAPQGRRRYGTGVTRAFPFSIICIARIFIPEVVHAS
jgi:hypothetical protein